MWTKQFWMDATERAVKTGAQFLIGYLGTAGLTDKVSGDFLGALVAIGIGVGLSVVFSLASSLIGSRNSASLVDADVPVAGLKPPDKPA